MNKVVASCGFKIKGDEFQVFFQIEGFGVFNLAIKRTFLLLYSKREFLFN